MRADCLILSPIVFIELNYFSGAQIILAMKVISIGLDLDSGLLIELPSVFEFGGYIFHVGTVIFGPWINFLEYKDLLRPQGKKVVSF